jgi:hypothetical protein
MPNAKMALALAASAVLCLQTVKAGPSAPPNIQMSENNDTALFIGLQYDFGDMQADLVAGARRTVTDTDNDVTGAKFDIAIPLTGENHAPTIRAMGIAGTTDVQGEAGIGYDFGKSQALIGAGAQGPYVNGGFNYYFGSILAPYLGLNSLDGAPARVHVQAAC